MIVGSTKPGKLELAEHLLNVPILAALEYENHKEYDALLKGDSNEWEALSLEDLEGLSIPPRPQLKGFTPIRTKTSVRALGLLITKMNSEIASLAAVKQEPKPKGRPNQRIHKT